MLYALRRKGEDMDKLRDVDGGREFVLDSDLKKRPSGPVPGRVKVEIDALFQQRIGEHKCAVRHLFTRELEFLDGNTDVHLLYHPT